MGHLTSLGGWGHYVNVDLHPLQGWESYRGELGTGTARWQEVGKSFGRRLPETGNWKPETERQNGGRGKESGSGGAGGGGVGQVVQRSAGLGPPFPSALESHWRLFAGLCEPVRRTHRGRRPLQKRGEK